jgi:hypothetical protein
MTAHELCPLSWPMPDWLHLMLGSLTLCLFLAAYQLVRGGPVSISGDVGGGGKKASVANANPLLLILLGIVGVASLVTYFYEPRRHVLAIWQRIDADEVTNPVSMDYTTPQTLADLHGSMPSEAQQTVRLHGKVEAVEVQGMRRGACYAELLTQLCTAYSKHLTCSAHNGSLPLHVCEASERSCPPAKP